MASKKEDNETEPVAEQSRSVTGRPNDLPIVTHEHPLPNSTLATRAKVTKKRVSSADNKAVENDDVKTK